MNTATRQVAPAQEDDPFLPSDYERPESGSNYMKFKDGENRFRILQKPIFGFVGWTQSGNNRSPVRKRMGEEFTPGEVIVDAKNKIRHFWAMPIYCYDNGMIQVLELTQSTIQSAVEGLAKNKKWGSPLGYDLCVIRKGEGMETEYSVVPEPKSPLDPAITELWALAQKMFNIEALYANGDPFDSQPPATAAGNGNAAGAGLRRFFALLDELVKIGALNAVVKDKGVDGKTERRRILKTNLGRDAEPHQMSPEDWGTVNNKLDLLIKQATPPEDDIPF